MDIIFFKLFFMTKKDNSKQSFNENIEKKNEFYSRSNKDVKLLKDFYDGTDVRE